MRDGSALVMEAAGERFVLPVDDSVLSAMGAPLPDSEDHQREQLTPRAIQGRIRRGESSAAIAVDTGMDLSFIARFERPVVAERAYQADLAAATIVRSRPLRERLAAHRFAAPAEGLQLVSEPPGIDAWLGDDDTHWILQAVWATGQAAHWQWRPGSGALVPTDSLARLISEEPARQDDLEAVLRPLRARPEPTADQTAPPPTSRGRRATVPSWDEITSGRPEPR